MSSAAIRFLAGLNSAAGLVSFSTLIAMLIRGKWAITRSFHSYIRVMVYLDCTAFVIAYIGQLSADGLSACGAKGFWLMGDLFWSAKDAFKYGYLMFRCTRIMNLKSKVWNAAIYGAFATSLLLYWFYMMMSYNLSGTCAENLIGNVNFNWSVLPLYVAWLSMDLIMAAGMLFSLKKMSDKITDMNKSLGKKDDVYSAVIAQERLRLVVNAVLMVILNIVSVLNVIGATAIPGNAIVFVFLQHWIVLSSSSVADDKSASQAQATATGSTSGTSSSGTAATAGTLGGANRTRNKSGK